MTEKELVKKIQKLKEIEPRKDWVLLTKSRILGEEPEVGQKEILTSLGRFFHFQFALKPAFVIPMALILIGGAIFYFSNLRDLRIAQVEYEQELAQLENLNSAFVRLQENISRTKEDLDKAEIKDPKTVLEIGKSIESTAKAGKEVLAETKKIVEATTSEKIVSEPQEQVLASITETEKALKDLENSYKQKVKETLEYLIEEVEHWALGEIDQEKFEEAKEDYQNKDYNQALEKILFLGY